MMTKYFECPIITIINSCIALLIIFVALVIVVAVIVIVIWCMLFVLIDISNM